MIRHSLQRPGLPVCEAEYIYMDPAYYSWVRIMLFPLPHMNWSGSHNIVTTHTLHIRWEGQCPLQMWRPVVPLRTTCHSVVHAEGSRTFISMDTGKFYEIQNYNNLSGAGPPNMSSLAMVPGNRSKASDALLGLSGRWWFFRYHACFRYKFHLYDINCLCGVGRGGWVLRWWWKHLFSFFNSSIKHDAWFPFSLLQIFY